jgi:hypothetical protein
MALLDVFKRKSRETAAAPSSNTDPARAAPDGPAAERVNTQEAAMPATENTVGSPANVTAAPTTPPPQATPGATASPAATGTAAAAEPAETPATLAQLKADFGDDPAFVLECLDKNRSLLAAHRARNVQLSAKAAGLARLGDAGKGGADPVASGPASAGGSADEGDYVKQCQKVAREKNIPFAQATLEVNRTHPHLRAAYAGRKSTDQSNAATAGAR